MAYRSDVYLKTTKEGYKKIRTMVKKCEKAYSLFRKPDNMKIEKAKDGYEEFISMEWNYLKWYDEYEEVDTIMDAIDTIRDTEPVHYVRLGEDVSDVEEIYDEPNGYRGGFEALELIRTVELNGEDIKDKEVK